MLVLTRKSGEEIVIDDSIKVRVTKVDASKVRLGIDAPHHIAIRRSELSREIGTQRKELPRNAKSKT